MAIPDYRSFIPNQWTTTSWRQQYRLIVDDPTNVPVGMMTNNVNGAQALWGLTPLTAAEIASPSQPMLDDLGATYQLTDYPYTRYWSDGIQLLPIGQDYERILTKTADYQITVSDNGATFTNNGAAGTVILTLPSPTVGLRFSFNVVTAQTLLIDVGGSIIIALAEVTSTAGGNASSASPYSFLTLKCLTSTLWSAGAMGGTWSAA